MSNEKDSVYIFLKKDLVPKYGQCNKYAIDSTGSIWIRADISEPRKAYVFAHELYHLNDKSKHWLWREIKATIAGVVWPLWGLVCVLWDFVAVKERRDFLVDRIRKKY